MRTGNAEQRSESTEGSTCSVTNTGTTTTTTRKQVTSWPSRKLQTEEGGGPIPTWSLVMPRRVRWRGRLQKGARAMSGSRK